MNLLLVIVAVIFLWPVTSFAQKTCTKVTSTTQNCLATVSWVAPTTGGAPAEYRIRRSDGGATPTEIGKVSANVLSFQNTFTDAGNIAHCWDVIASNSGGDAKPSTQACWTTPAMITQPPGTPSGVTISAIDNSTLRVTWDDVSNETGYEVSGRPAKGGQQFAVVATLPADTTTWDWTNRQPYTSYCAKVRALAASGLSNSADSAMYCATTNK